MISRPRRIRRRLARRNRFLARTPRPSRIRRMRLEIAKRQEARRLVEAADVIRHEAEERARRLKVIHSLRA